MNTTTAPSRFVLLSKYNTMIKSSLWRFYIFLYIIYIKFVSMGAMLFDRRYNNVENILFLH